MAVLNAVTTVVLLITVTTMAVGASTTAAAAAAAAGGAAPETAAPFAAASSPSPTPLGPASPSAAASWYPQTGGDEYGRSAAGGGWELDPAQPTPLAEYEVMWDQANAMMRYATGVVASDGTLYAFMAPQYGSVDAYYAGVFTWDYSGSTRSIVAVVNNTVAWSYEMPELTANLRRGYRTADNLLYTSLALVEQEQFLVVTTMYYMLVLTTRRGVLVGVQPMFAWQPMTVFDPRTSIMHVCAAAYDFTYSTTAPSVVSQSQYVQIQLVFPSDVAHVANLTSSPANCYAELSNPSNGGSSYPPANSLEYDDSEQGCPITLVASQTLDAPCSTAPVVAGVNDTVFVLSTYIKSGNQIVNDCSVVRIEDWTARYVHMFALFHDINSCQARLMVDPSRQAVAFAAGTHTLRMLLVSLDFQLTPVWHLYLPFPARNSSLTWTDWVVPMTTMAPNGDMFAVGYSSGTLGTAVCAQLLFMVARVTATGHMVWNRTIELQQSYTACSVSGVTLLDQVLNVEIVSGLAPQLERPATGFDLYLNAATGATVAQLFPKLYPDFGWYPAEETSPIRPTAPSVNVVLPGPRSSLISTLQWTKYSWECAASAKTSMNGLICAGAGMCENQQCKCLSNFNGTDCSGCANDAWGPFCTVCTTCNDRGTCAGSGTRSGQGTCQCKAPFYGSSCSQCPPQTTGPECATPCPQNSRGQYCNGHGFCAMSIFNGPSDACECTLPFVGASCEQCQPGFALPNCNTCSFGYYMQNGQCLQCPAATIVNGTITQVCNGGGECVTSGPNAGNCDCLAGFTGYQCSQCAYGYWGPTCQACPGFTPQNNQICNGAGNCDGSGTHSGSGTCSCQGGLDPTTACASCPQPSSNWIETWTNGYRVCCPAHNSALCNGHGTCSGQAVYSSGVCSCTGGWDGFACETAPPPHHSSSGSSSHHTSSSSGSGSGSHANAPNNAPPAGGLSTPEQVMICVAVAVCVIVGLPALIYSTRRCRQQPAAAQTQPLLRNAGPADGAEPPLPLPAASAPSGDATWVHMASVVNPEASMQDHDELPPSVTAVPAAMAMVPAFAPPCAICGIRPRDTVFTCGHFTCGICAQNMSTCFACHARIESRIHLKL